MRLAFLVAITAPSPSLRAECDLPVIPIRQLPLPTAEPLHPWSWAEAFGISPETWRDVTRGDDKTAHELQAIIEQGIVDYADLYTNHFPTDINLEAGLDLQIAWRAMKSILEEPSIGELYGNALVVETVPLYLLLAPLPQGLPDVAFAEEMDTMQRLLKGLGLLSKRYKSKKTQRCLQLLSDPGLRDAEELCSLCKTFFSCRQTKNTTRLQRATLWKCSPLTESLLSGLQPLWAVRLLDIASFTCLRPKVLEALVTVFPNLKTLRVRELEGPRPLPSEANPRRMWWPTLQSLEVEIGTPEPPAWLCELKGLRRLNIYPADKGSIKVLPECLGELTELVHLNVVGNNLTGAESLPASLSQLVELRVFDAYENGRYMGPDHVDNCPHAEAPDRERCVPGYVSRADGVEPAWRCPSAGWNIRLEDRSLPWWHWRKIEKMHIDANFIFGHIPEDLPDYWPRLRSLDLHDLRLSGPLPASLAKLENLTQLQVQLNDLECSGGEDAVGLLMEHPKMHTLNLDANPRLCGCAPTQTKANLVAQVGETQIRVGCRENKTEL